MKKLLLSILFCCTIVLSAQEGNADEATHNAIRAMRDRLVTAINGSDIDAALAELHENVVITWHNAEVSRGHKAVKDYFERMMTGPNRIVQSFKFSMEVDELTILYGGDTGVAFGSMDESYQLAQGAQFDLKSRWSATMVKLEDRWVVASIHTSTNLFDNVFLRKQQNILYGIGVIATVIGLLLGLIVGRKTKKA